MSLLTQKQLEEIQTFHDDIGECTFPHEECFIKELIEWNEKQTAQFEPVATKLESHQFNAFHVSADDFKKLQKLPTGTKIYTAPPKREPPITSREMYQRGYATAERYLKREPLSDEEINAINLPEKQCTLRELVRLIEKEHGITGEIK